VLETKNTLLKIMFILVVERSIGQISFLIKNYSIIVNKRGNFYGEQYRKLLEQLELEKAKLENFEELKNKLLEDEQVEDYIKNLEKNK
jgi:hypothetical protein